MTAAPLALMAELTHRCPLQCPYCSNPLDLVKVARERDAAFWHSVIDEAAELGVLQIHFSGGEPTLRPDLAALIAHATARGLYANLITSAVLLNAEKLTALEQAGLAHVQISIQGAAAVNADRIGNYNNGHAKKLEIAALVGESGMSLTLNAVVHRQNLVELRDMIELSAALNADRLEIAHVQYHGWALRNRVALMPTREAVEAADAIVADAREAWHGRMVIDYVVPDYYAATPKACMGGWGSTSLNVTPDGSVLPCHAAKTIPGLVFSRAGETSLREIWYNDAAFERFRGTGWMREPCASCALKEVDFGGCRCQALALAGDANAADPVCHLSPRHGAVLALATAESVAGNDRLVYRRP
jgi:pyrroloquinoline quinone biosynthesis protein E